MSCLVELWKIPKVEISQPFWEISSNVQPLLLWIIFSSGSATISFIAFCCVLSFCYVPHRINSYLIALIYVTEIYRSIPSFIFFFFSSIRHSSLRPFITLFLVCQCLSYTGASKMVYNFATALQHSSLRSTRTKGITPSCYMLSILYLFKSDPICS